MALKYLVDLNINDNVLQNARVLSSGTAPSALIGAIYVDTGDSNKLKYHNGTAFVALGTGTATGDLTAIVAGSGMTGTSLIWSNTNVECYRSRRQVLLSKR